MLNERYKVFYHDKEFDLWIKTVAPLVQQENNNLIEGGNDGNVKRFLLEFNNSEDITHENLIKDLGILSNLKNKFAKLTTSEIKILSSFLSLRKINFAEGQTLDGNCKAVNILIFVKNLRAKF